MTTPNSSPMAENHTASARPYEQSSAMLPTHHHAPVTIQQKLEATNVAVKALLTANFWLQHNTGLLHCNFCQPVNCPDGFSQHINRKGLMEIRPNNRKCQPSKSIYEALISVATS